MVYRGSVPIFGIAETADEDNEDRDSNGYEGDRDETNETRQWHRENDDYLHLTRGQGHSSSSSTGVNASTQTDFVQVFFQIGMLSGPMDAPYTHTHVSAYLDGCGVD